MVESAEYSSWIKSFDTDIKHVICGAGHDTRNSRSPFIAATLTNYKLCTVCPELFSDVFSSQTWFNSHITGSDHLEEDTPSTDAIMQIGCSSLQLKILPMSQRGFSLSQHGVLKLKDKISEFRALLTADPSLSRSANCRKNYVSDDCVDDTKADSRQNRVHTRALNVFGDNRIMFLGTGCAMPSKYRNVSGIALHLSHKADNSCAGIPRQNSIVLLDVGEGSWYQLMRLACNDPSVFLSDKNHHLDSGLKIKLVQYTVARELAVAWISHPHAGLFINSYHISYIFIYLSIIICLCMYRSFLGTYHSHRVTAPHPY